MGLVWVLTPMAVFCVVGALLLPEDPPSRAARAGLSRLGRWVGRLVGRLVAPMQRAWRRRYPPP
ncbi:hypothetical protein, partial [Actinotalea ferrariae]|uniref:hypothetical protein n=1 Tax=Actinotalea ferrariae TaxID=1386098 RepID=UPI000554DB00